MKRFVSLATLLTCSLGAASADITALFNGTIPSQTASTTALGSTINGMPIGTFSFTDTATQQNFGAFCIDYYQPVTPGETYNFEVRNLNDMPTIGGSELRISRYQELFDRFYGDTIDNATNASAFQLAAWELLFDGAKPGPLSLSSGDFTATNNTDAIATANSWLGIIDNPKLADPTTNLQLVGLFSPTNQDQITVVPNPIPAPAGLVLLLIGGAAVVARRKFAAKTTEVAVA